jgi:hypothetical protein
MLSFFENIVICNYDCPVNKCTSIFHFEKLLNCMYCLFLILQLTSIQEHDRAIFCPLLSLHRFSLNIVWRQVIALCNCLILYVTSYLLYFILLHLWNCNLLHFHDKSDMIWGFIYCNYFHWFGFINGFNLLILFIARLFNMWCSTNVTYHYRL